MKRIFLVMLFCFAFSGLAYAAGCVTEECHSDVQEYEYLHGPTAATQCEVCHTASSEELENHKKRPKSFIDFKSPVKDGPVCVMCHSNQRDGKNVHFPVENGDCTSCHNPHGGNNKFFVKGKAEADTCMQCHEKGMFNKKYQHGPLAAGECASCHDPHASNYKAHLRFPPDELCYQCHGDKKEAFNKAVVHAPIKDGCTSCHAPHSSNAKFHLKSASEKELCVECHKETTPKLMNRIKNAEFQHKPVEDGNCGGCHNPHASEFGQLLRSDAKTVCFSCHSELGNRVNNAEYVHGPVATSGCSACHSPHGSDDPYILLEYFPEEFYNPYQQGMYQLCFECHDQKILAKQYTQEATKFRNGNENLHYTHVMIKGKGRSCKACHEVHASNQPLQIRKSVPYGSGDWRLPVNFTKKKNGGTCVVGCHKPKTYNRKNAYSNQ